MKIFDLLLIFDPVFSLELLQKLGNRGKVFDLVVEGLHVCKTVLHLEFLPELNPVDYLRSHVEFLVQLFYNLVLNDPVGPPQTSLLPFPRPEGQHVVVLIGIGLP